MEEKKRGHFRRKYMKLRCGRCKLLRHDTRGCRGTITSNIKEETQKEATSGETSMLEYRSLDCKQSSLCVMQKQGKGEEKV